MLLGSKKICRDRSRWLVLAVNASTSERRILRSQKDQRSTTEEGVIVDGRNEDDLEVSQYLECEECDDPKQCAIMPWLNVKGMSIIYHTMNIAL